MRISIIMPVKNAGLYLKECLDSILTQTYADWELVSIDDHSEDSSYQILKDYESKDDRIKCLRNNDNGIIPALRLAYQNSSGKYITRMDADDIMTSNKLELLFEQLDQHGKGTLAVGLVKYISTTELGEGYKSYEKWLNNLSIEKLNFDWIYKECVIPSPAWMLHRDDLDRCGAFNHDTYPEDYDLAFRMRAANLKVQPTSQVVHYWRDHPERSSRTDDNYRDNSFLKLKVHHFLKTDYRPSIQLILWGCGKKGKKVARLLIEAEIAFKWVSNNPKKIGHDIYGKIIESDQTLPEIEWKQVIIAIAEEINLSLVMKELTIVTNAPPYLFFFC